MKDYIKIGKTTVRLSAILSLSTVKPFAAEEDDRIITHAVALSVVREGNNVKLWLTQDEAKDLERLLLAPPTGSRKKS